MDVRPVVDATKAHIEVVCNAHTLSQSAIKYTGGGVFIAEYMAPPLGETLNIAASVWGVAVPGSPFTVAVRESAHLFQRTQTPACSRACLYASEKGANFQMELQKERRVTACVAMGETETHTGKQTEKRETDQRRRG